LVAAVAEHSIAPAAQATQVVSLVVKPIAAQPVAHTAVVLAH